MALQISFTTAQGIECPAAYGRISDIRHTHTETTVNVDVWASQAARQSDKATVTSQAFSLPWTDGVSVSGAYIALKNEEFFAGALDV